MKILSEGKFRDFDGFYFMGNKSTNILQFDDNSKIECTEDHEFLREDGKWIEAKDIKIYEKYSGKKLISYVETNEKKPVYDAINVVDTHSFYAEGLTVHNCSLLYIDEAAFVENWDEFFASVFPTISSGKTTKILFTSTPNGLNHFYKTFQGAKEETNGYAWVEVPWWEVPDRDEAWKNEILKGLDFNLQKFNQEFCVEFLGSSGTLIDGSTLKRLKYQIPLIDSDDLKVYEERNKTNTYVCIVDVSRGKGLDYSAFQIIDVSKMPYNQVATFRSNLISPSEYSQKLFEICKHYNDCAVLVEINDIGAQVADLLHDDYEYENVLFTESAGRSGKRISSGFGTSNIDRGIRTTVTVKSIGCSILKLLIEQDKLIINDFNTINELSSFSRKGKSYEAESGHNDDLVMGLVLFAWLSDQKFFREMTDINTLKMLRERSEQQIMDDLLPFGFYQNAVEDHDNIEEIPYDHYSIRN